MVFKCIFSSDYISKARRHFRNSRLDRGHHTSYLRAAYIDIQMIRYGSLFSAHAGAAVRCETVEIFPRVMGPGP